MISREVQLGRIRGRVNALVAGPLGVGLRASHHQEWLLRKRFTLLSRKHRGWSYEHLEREVLRISRLWRIRHIERYDDAIRRSQFFVVNDLVARGLTFELNRIEYKWHGPFVTACQARLVRDELNNREGLAFVMPPKQKKALKAYHHWAYPKQNQKVEGT